jgi:hypothetical protein
LKYGKNDVPERFFQRYLVSQPIGKAVFETRGGDVRAMD